jgi:hydrogenase-4 component E
MSETNYRILLDLAAGLFLLCAIGVLWRRQIAAAIRLFGVQGLALAAIVAIIGVHERSLELVLVAAGLAALRAGVLPWLAHRALGDSPAEARETRPVVNVATSLLAATEILPAALAVVLIGFFVLVTRRRALSQVVGFLVLDNGITATAFLAASGVPLIVELGVSFDLLLVVLVLQVLTTRLRTAFGSTDLDELRELRDR